MASPLRLSTGDTGLKRLGCRTCAINGLFLDGANGIRVRLLTMAEYASQMYDTLLPISFVPSDPTSPPRKLT